MVVLDTSVVIEKVRRREEIVEFITAVTLVEFPQAVKYRFFTGEIIFPMREDYFIAHELQKKYF